MTQRTMFDVQAAPAQYDDMPLAPVRGEAGDGERRKREGMHAAAQSKESQLGYARELAMDLARANDGIAMLTWWLRLWSVRGVRGWGTRPAVCF